MQSVTNNTVQHVLNGAGGEQARAYLDRARRHADIMNAVVDQADPAGLDLEDHQKLAETNALVALAMAIVPAESTVLKG